MYIERYWNKYIGGSDDSLALLEYLEDKHKQKEEITLGAIFSETGLDQLASFEKTDRILVATVDEYDERIFYAIDLITDLAGLMLECKVNGSVNIGELLENETDCFIRITATHQEHALMNKALLDFTTNPLNYDLRIALGDDEILEMAKGCEEMRKELYE